MVYIRVYIIKFVDEYVYVFVKSVMYFRLLWYLGFILYFIIYILWLKYKNKIRIIWMNYGII